MASNVPVAVGIERIMIVLGLGVAIWGLICAYPDGSWIIWPILIFSFSIALVYFKDGPLHRDALGLLGIGRLVSAFVLVLYVVLTIILITYHNIVGLSYYVILVGISITILCWHSVSPDRGLEELLYSQIIIFLGMCVFIDTEALYAQVALIVGLPELTSHGKQLLIISGQANGLGLIILGGTVLTIGTPALLTSYSRIIGLCLFLVTIGFFGINFAYAMLSVQGQVWRFYVSVPIAIILLIISIVLMLKPRRLMTRLMNAIHTFDAGLFAKLEESRVYESSIRKSDKFTPFIFIAGGLYELILFQWIILGWPLSLKLTGFMTGIVLVVIGMRRLNYEYDIQSAIGKTWKKLITPKSDW